MDQQFAIRSDMDFLRRSLPGVMLYAAIWPLLAWTTNFYQAAPTFTLIFSSAFIGISVLRIMHAFSTQYVYSRYKDVWRSLLFFLGFSHAATLSTLVVLMINKVEYHQWVITSLLIVLTVISGASSSLAPKPKFTQSYIALLSIPGALACYYSDNFQYLVPLFLLCWLYAIISARRFFHEYRRAFTVESKLKENQKKLERLNQTDSLTGIYNRQYFDDALSIQWDLAVRSHTHLSILFLDLDFFKKVNDQYGHLVGDKVLCHTAHLLKDCAKRKSDMIARYGGEEFAIILPLTQHRDAMELAESIRQSLQEKVFVDGGHRISLTTCIGVNSTCPAQQQDWHTFLDQADQALYQAKAKGRNCVVSFLDTVCELKNNRLI